MIGGSETTGKTVGRWVFAALFVLAGVGHFALTDFFVRIMPPYVPYPRAMVLLSGVIEIVLGVLLVIPRTSRLAAWGLIALLVAVFPANVHMYLHAREFALPPLLLLLRLPIQGLLIFWAWIYVRRAAA
ncbi:MAG: putative rane protein [Planctomycetota bacterium]|nr:putative rane protein [Planctomycetota bacterium]